MEDGSNEGTAVGRAVGLDVGVCVGAAVGAAAGAAVGAVVTTGGVSFVTTKVGGSPDPSSLVPNSEWNRSTLFKPESKMMVYRASSMVGKMSNSKHEQQQKTTTINKTIP